MRSNLKEQKLMSIKQVKSPKKSRLIKNGFIFFAMSIFVLLNIHIKSILADSTNLAEKIKKAEKNVVFTVRKYDKYYNLGESIMGAVKDDNSKYVKLDYMDKSLKNIINSIYIDKEFFDAGPEDFVNYSEGLNK